jgi:hypothetical protein
MGFLDDLGKFREVGLEPLLELVGRAADGFVAGPTISRGVLAGTNQPCQLDDSKPTSPLSATVGTSGSAAERLAPATASARVPSQP